MWISGSTWVALSRHGLMVSVRKWVLGRWVAEVWVMGGGGGWVFGLMVVVGFVLMVVAKFFL